MTVSPITPVSIEGQPKELSSFLRSGVMYVVWTDAVGSGISSLRQVRWKPHTGANFSEVISPLIGVFNSFSTLYRQPTDSLFVVWDDGGSTPGVENGNIYGAVLNVLTGAVISGPTFLAQGESPQLCYTGSGNTNEMLLYFRTPKNYGVYGQRTFDGGVTWESAYPLVTGQVRETDNIRVVPYDDGHVSISQSGKGSRLLLESSAYYRTRPLSSIVKHPTQANQFYVAEPSKGSDNITLIDNLRGALKLATNNGSLYHLDGVQQGTSDGIGAISLLSVSGTTFSNLGYAGPVASPAGRNLVQYTLNLAPGSLSLVLPGSLSFAVDFDVSATYAYVAEYSDSTTNGQFVVVRLSDGSNSTVMSGVTAVRAVSVANFLSTPLIFVATTESGVERLRIYEESGLAPTLLMNVKMPARVNNLSVAAGSGSASVRVIASMVDRLSQYDYYGSSSPVRCVDTFQFSSVGSQFFRSVVSSNGNVFVAAGSSGVVAFGPNGKVLSQSLVSGEVVNEWKPTKAYSLNTLIRPRESSPFSPNRYYFRCSSAGTSGVSDPAWALTGTISDSSASWVPVGVIDGVVTDVVLDETLKRVYAVGSAGGNLGTDGRVWILSAGGLL